MPYVLNDPNVTVIERDVKDYDISGTSFDLVHDDIDRVGVGPSDMKLATSTLNRFLNYANHVKYAVCTLRVFNGDILHLIHANYQKYGGIRIFKPYYSNPWKLEYVVVFSKKVNTHTMGKRKLMVQFNFFLNEMADSMVLWNNIIDNQITSLQDGHDCDVNPNQTEYSEIFESSLKG